MLFKYIKAFFYYISNIFEVMENLKKIYLVFFFDSKKKNTIFFTIRIYLIHFVLIILFYTAYNKILKVEIQPSFISIEDFTYIVNGLGNKYRMIK